MKHKPMLLRKITMQNRDKFREVIGLIGTHHGVGVTYTGLMLAFYLGEELGKKTAFVECNGHRDMEFIHTSYEWTKEDNNSFSYRQITCYKEVALERIADLLSEEYDCVIFDFGTDLTTSKEEFLRCQTKIVVGGRSEWDQQKLMRFADVTESIRGSATWKYVIPQAEERAIHRLKHELRNKVWAVPLTMEPTRSTKVSNRVFADLLLS